ncbi:class I SAM-dependent methyltransferase [Flavobacterium sp. F372]|uniref:Class I SAM-dependent methyltransferase n=1 Tax=Flavobacterium bernardetii TaxID=2813823 RepID=A0ABR7J1X1_9FLAO|nr:class I SAM-dependent methyltransferase [Flavobacterium bernardetii]MBC5836076.1 class I SAM-dependent methyltransferase [Flavobacterium bernardetii]NHF71184.1 class I SAM-dependent methyltransferase [Flavobacterium bernardetii]
MSDSTAKNSENWFSTWFDTPYYHILYKNRNDEEAQAFMDNITHYLNMPENGTILDLACGKGRHSIYLNKLGYNVTGVDLSENSIAIAKDSSNETLQFKTHDMREPMNETYDAVFNLFTSFGYFDTHEDNIKTLKAIKESINEYGFGVIDFFNADFIIENLVAEETKEIDGITFHIKRSVENKKIIKEIRFEDKGESFFFTEKVSAFTLADFEAMMEEAGIYLLEIFGDYKLRKFYKTQSERLILLFK